MVFDGQSRHNARNTKLMKRFFSQPTGFTTPHRGQRHSGSSDLMGARAQTQCTWDDLQEGRGARKCWSGYGSEVKVSAGGVEKHRWVFEGPYAEVNFATALVPSDMACLASSPGRVSLTAVWISREVSVFVLLILPSFPVLDGRKGNRGITRE